MADVKSKQKCIKSEYIEADN